MSATSLYHGIAIDPLFVITHRLSLDAAPEAGRMFRDRKDQCIKVALKRHGETIH